MRLLIRKDEARQKTRGGIVLPDTAQEKPQRAKVLAVGSGHYEFGHHVPLEVEVGDEILFSKYGGTEVKDGGKDLLILRESDILAVIGKPAKGKK